jgi:hypothetical protein
MSKLTKSKVTKLLKHAFHLTPVVGLGICMFLYPTWIIDGYLYEWYPTIAAGVAVYGGFVANLVWYIKQRKHL